MKLELEIFSSLCSARVFTINGVEADVEDFGEKYDRNPENAEDYSCANMQFTRLPAVSSVLKKYSINAEEYNFVAETLENGLSFGCCGLCS